MLSNYGRLAVAELVFYCPLLFANLWVAKRRSFDRRTAWIYLLFLAVIRIIGASVQLRSEQSLQQPLIKLAAIASSVGIAPLELFFNWHLKRINGGMTGRGGVSRYVFFGVYTLVAIAVVLAIAGGATATYSALIPFHAKTLSKVAIVILIVTFLGMVGVNIVLVARLGHVAKGEKTPLFAVTIGTPFLASRLVFSCISAYYVSQTFHPVVGNVYVLAFMSVFEEFIVVLLYFFACSQTPPAGPKARDLSLGSGEHRASTESRAPSHYYEAETGLPDEEAARDDPVVPNPDQLVDQERNGGSENKEDNDGIFKARQGASNASKVDEEPWESTHMGIEMRSVSRASSLPCQQRISRKGSLMDSMMDLDERASTTVDPDSQSRILL